MILIRVGDLYVWKDKGEVLLEGSGKFRLSLLNDDNEFRLIFWLVRSVALCDKIQKRKKK